MHIWRLAKACPRTSSELPAHAMQLVVWPVILVIKTFPSLFLQSPLPPFIGLHSTYPVTLTQVSLVFICAEYLGSMLFPGHFWIHIAIVTTRKNATCCWHMLHSNTPRSLTAKDHVWNNIGQTRPSTLKVLKLIPWPQQYNMLTHLVIKTNQPLKDQQSLMYNNFKV